MTLVTDFTLFADYFSLYLLDDAEIEIAPERWTTDDMLRKCVFGGDYLVVCTARNMDVPLRVEVLPEAPPLDLTGWQHIVDGAIKTETGQLIIMGCTDYEPDAARLKLAPGTYRARISMTGLDSLSEDHLEGEDRYRIQLWPGPWQEVRARRLYDPEDSADAP
ncbi:hypothetical protein [Pacificoceanicola onchidii]|uniref:hypothetical protein n=1 Tax=Pacificoceanicola onchidii TaxID=2562685 RepID=UPI0010A55BD1|nr:hypothetical protein [Pacificoceanicola onchidii]